MIPLVKAAMESPIRTEYHDSMDFFYRVLPLAIEVHVFQHVLPVKVLIKKIVILVRTPMLLLIILVSDSAT